jgi:fumarate hydratase class II
LTIKGTIRKREKVIKPIEVDAMDILVGTMKDQFNTDINSFIKEMNSFIKEMNSFIKEMNSFIKEMNPCVGYEKQK